MSAVAQVLNLAVSNEAVTNDGLVVERESIREFWVTIFAPLLAIGLSFFRHSNRLQKQARGERWRFHVPVKTPLWANVSVWSFCPYPVAFVAAGTPE
jgi:hypothetical protein